MSEAYGATTRSCARLRQRSAYRYSNKDSKTQIAIRQERQEHQLVFGLLDAEARQERRFAIDHDVHGHADQDLGQHVEHLVQGGVGRGQGRLAAVRAGVPKEPAQRVPCKVL